MKWLRLERHRVRMERALESVSALLTSREERIPRLDASRIFAIARDAKTEDTYHSTTIEGYRTRAKKSVQSLKGPRIRVGPSRRLNV